MAGFTPARGGIPESIFHSHFVAGVVSLSPASGDFHCNLDINSDWLALVLKDTRFSFAATLAVKQLFFLPTLTGDS